MTKFQVGDVIKGHGHGSEGIIREITEVRETGYTWRYPDLPHTQDNEFLSENSNDPMLVLGWQVTE